MDEFALKGHTVYVIGTHGSDKLPNYELNVENKISVLRVYSGKIRKTSHIRKAIALLTLDVRMLKAISKYLIKTKIDLIIGTTPSITLSLLFKKLKKHYKASFYLLLKDMWPQGSVDLKVLRKYCLPWIYLRLHEIRIYKTADYIGCMSAMGVEYIISKNKYLPQIKVEVCPNCIRPSLEVPVDSTADIRLKYNIPSDACVFIFSGNLGLGHGLEFLADAIKKLEDYSKAFFVIGGSGTHFSLLKDQFKNKSNNNVLLYDWLPTEDFNKILATSDVGLILLHKYTVPQFPSRLLSYLDYAKPVLCVVNRGTDIGTTVENSGCGRSMIHGNLDKFVEYVKFFSENKIERMKMGKNARKLILDNYTVSHGYEIIMGHFNNKKQIKSGTGFKTIIENV